MSLKTKRFYEFGGYRLDASERLLRRGGEVVPLPPKAIEVLVALVENGGRVLEKEELMRQVWPDSFVEEANLSHHIFSLRKALGENKTGDKFIETIPRRGYRFVAPVTEVLDEGADIVVTERHRAHILIEEETEANDLLSAAGESSGESSGESGRRRPAPATTPASRLRSQPVLATLLGVGLFLAGSLALLSWQLSFKDSFKDNRALEPKESRAAAGAAMEITRLTNFDRCISNISPDGKFICYVQNYYGGIGTLWVRQLATNTDYQLLDPGERIFNGTAFSPDGQFIYYCAIDPHNPKGALFRIPVLGGPPKRLLDYFGSMFSLSPDGRQVAFFRYFPDTKLWSMIASALDGSDEQTLLTIRYPDQIFFGTPSWSPDGKLIAFGVTVEPEQSGPNGNIRLFTIDISSREVKLMTEEHWTQVGRMTWSADGQSLFLVASRPRLGNQLYSLDYSRGEVRRLTSGLQSYGNYGLGITADSQTLVADGWESSSQIWVISGDGQTGDADRLTTGIDDGAHGIALLGDGRIVYSARSGDERDLWIMNADGTDARPLMADSFTAGQVTATADGRHLVFASTRAGGSHIFRMDVDGNNLRQITFGDGYESTPDCSPDGKWVVYASRTGDKSTIWRVPIEGGTPVQLTDYHSIAPSLSPDGKFLSCILPTGEKAEKGGIAVVGANGGPPLKTFKVVQFEWDYVTPRWAPDGQAIVYTEKQNGVGNLWKQPLAGGSPKPLTDFKTDYIFNFAFARDGKNIALARGPNGAYVVLIKDFR